MIFLDTSVVLDLILVRKDQTVLDKMLAKISQKEDVYAISMLTIHLVYYFAKKSGEDLDQVKTWLEAVNILDLNEGDYLFVLENLDTGDMEDSLQIACSIRNNCQKVITSDRKMVKKYNKFIPIEALG